MRWIRLIVIAVLLVALTVVVVPMAVGASMMWTLIHPGCDQSNSTPANFDLPNYQELSIPAKAGGLWRAFFIPGVGNDTTSRPIIIIPPPYASSRGGMLHEGSIMAKDGFNVLVFESRVCAGKGVVSLGYNEVDDVGDVLEYLKTNATPLHVDLAEIALHGFSSAGATSIMATARYKEIHAVLAEGGYASVDAQLQIPENGSLIESLMIIGARIAYRVGTGQDVNVLTPVEAIRNIPPRWIFLIYGTAEPSFPGAHLQYNAAKSVDANAPIRLWEVPGAHHGGYIDTAGMTAYSDHALAFYRCALRSQCDVWNTMWNTNAKP